MQGSLVAARARYPRGFVLEALYSVITRSFNQSSDWLAIQSAASNWWLNASTFSIVPSGQSFLASCCNASRRAGIEFAGPAERRAVGISSSVRPYCTTVTMKAAQGFWKIASSVPALSWSWNVAASHGSWVLC